MKPIVFVCLLLMSMLSLQCSKKSDDLSGRMTTILGKWKVIQFGYDSNNNGVLEASEIQNAPSDPVQEQEFLAGGSATMYFIISGTTYTTNYSWSLINDYTQIQLISNPGTVGQITTTQLIYSLDKTSLIEKNNSATDSSYVILSKL